MVKALHEVQSAILRIIELLAQYADRLVETDEVADRFLISTTRTLCDRKKLEPEMLGKAQRAACWV